MPLLARLGGAALLLAVVAAQTGSSSTGRLERNDRRREVERLRGAGKLREARALLKGEQQTLPADASATDRGELLEELGDLYRRWGKGTEAIASYEEASDVLGAAYGSDDPRYGLVIDKLADAHVDAGSPELALPMYEGLLRAMSRGLGASHPGYQLTLGNIGKQALAVGRHKAAVKAYRELLRLQEGGNVDAAARAGTSMQLSRALAETGKLTSALKHARGAVALHDSGEATLAEPLEHAFAVNAAAGVLEKMGRDEEAVSAMERALELARSDRSAEEGMVRQAQRNLDGLRAHVRRKAARREEKERRERTQREEL